ncbi:MAG: hypothetical protein ACYYK0_03595 [Candidatus Eutrophobiaceae bacterium]
MITCFQTLDGIAGSLSVSCADSWYDCKFKALRVHADQARWKKCPSPICPEGEVLIRVSTPSINYKDALAVTGRGKIIRDFHV